METHGNWLCRQGWRDNAILHSVAQPNNQPQPIAESPSPAIDPFTAILTGDDRILLASLRIAL